MYKLLLVDDEKLTCETIKNFIPWHVHQIKEVRTANNGLEALEIYQEYQPDILVCDIHMPHMNGIELISKLKDIGSKSKVILISGFADKDYLKAAIELKVSSFIEKPLMPNDVLDAVKQVINEIEDEVRQVNYPYPGYENALKLTAIKKLISEDYAWSDVLNLLDSISCYPLLTKNLLPVIVTVTLQSLVPTQQRVNLNNDMITAINNNDVLKNTLASIHSDTQFVIFLPIASGNMNDITNKLNLLDTQLKLAMPVKIKCKYACGSVITDGKFIKQCYDDALTACNNQFYTHGDDISFDYSLGIRYEPRITMYSNYRIVLNNRDQNEIKAFYEQLQADVMEHKDQNINSIKNIFFNLMIVLLDYAFRKGNNDMFRDSDKPYVWIQIHEASNLFELIDFIQTLTETYLIEDKQSIASDKIHLIKKYIGENFSDNNLTMADIAHHFNYSTNYLSNLFKKETGITLIEYTTNIRLDHAKQLITTTNLKLYDVARESGFYDSNYFSTVFKRVVGTSPSKYEEVS